MAVLLLRLAGPMQSWGTQSRFTNRDTELEPSKSGVIGLLCAAMGIPRNDTVNLKRLAQLKMGVRIDREGTIKRDFHTAQNVAKAGGGKPKTCEPSDRYYLADAVFLVALLGSIELLDEINTALQNPTWQLFLGRKSFVPSLPIWLNDGLQSNAQSLEDALKNYPYLCYFSRQNAPPEDLRAEIETQYGYGDRVKQDQPESYEIHHRTYSLRYIVNTYIKRSELPEPKEELCTFLA